MRAALRWLFPGGVVAGAVAAGLWYAPGGDAFVEMLTRRYEALAFVVAAGLALAFHRSRVLALVAGLAVVEASARFGLTDASVQPALSVGAALLLGFGAVVRDRGVTSTGGLAQLGAALGLTAALVLALRRPSDFALDLIPWEAREAGGSPWAAPPVPASLALGLGGVLTAWAAYRRRGPVERGLVWSFALVVASAIPGLEDQTVSLLRMGATLALGLAVLETSYAMAYRDELTGLPGRRSLVRDLEGLSGTYTLAMVDVDHFKQFNDEHGHDVGDQVLRLVASRLAKAPAGGRAYRYGGEEFTLLYRGMSRSEARPHLEAVRASVAAARFSLRSWGRPAGKEAGKARRGQGGKGRRPGHLSVTVSVGVADSSAGATPGEILDSADKALYRAKRGGRDRVAV